MSKLVINVNLYPKSGYRFIDQNGTVHLGNSWVNLINKVINYRRRAKFPIGNVEAEVTAQACKENPAHCRDESEETMRKYRKISLKGRVLQFLSLARKHKETGQLNFVQPIDAHNRTNVCVRCPHNTALPTGCGSCNAARKEAHKEILNPGRQPDSRMHGCEILGEDLAVAAHLDRVSVDVPELPAHCWRKKTL